MKHGTSIQAAQPVWNTAKKSGFIRGTVIHGNESGVGCFVYKFWVFWP